MKIYTRTGDKGETGLWGGARVPKNDRRVTAYGDVDELNCVLGAALAEIEPQENLRDLRGELRKIQQELFVIGAMLASPPDIKKSASSRTPPLDPDAVKRMEAAIDSMTAGLEPLSNFILPGGGKAGAGLHWSRAVCRRAERSAVALAAAEAVSAEIVVYLNRLSDYLFTAARWANHQSGKTETLWSAAK
ncbi:MAG TPA: cob(I)yrinic acid a,c-diamide adenosyltransferase [Elusimicrobiota bacterium]|nr:cob(I)yrinic acid a,c-diamide adenosyltransferase [Elusimicrobiota bacterium]